MHTQLILASASPRRKEILEQIGLEFQIHVSNVDENVSKELSPIEVVQALAHQKAKKVAEELTIPSAVVIGADTIVVYNNQILGKPEDKEEAKSMLQLLQGKTHQVYTGISLMEVTAGDIMKELTKHNVTHVTMRPLTEEKIDWYVNTKEPLDKAGSYGIQGLGALLVKKIEGCYSNVVGLSVPLLDEMMEELDGSS